MSRSRILIFASAFLLLAVGAQAQVSQSAVQGSAAPIDGSAFGAACSINNLQGALASGFLNYNAPGGGHAVYIDPAASGGAGDPGCGAGDFMTQNFRFDDLVIDIADASAFNSGTGMGMAEWSITIHELATPGDPCGGPGAMIFDTGAQMLTMTGAGQYFPVVPVNQEFDGPFFVQWNLLSLSNANEPISPLWDGVQRPLCRQWITQDSNATYVDHNDFFNANSDLGWLDIIVNGEFVDRGPDAPDFGTSVDVNVPTASTYGLIALGLLLAGFGFFAIRRFN